VSALRYPRYVPDYRIQINDRDLPAALRSSITSVKHEEGQNAADRVEIGLANQNLRFLQQHIRGLGFRPFPSGVKIGQLPGTSVAPPGLFDLDNKLTVAMGYAPDRLDPMFIGEITGVEANFPNDGMPSMTLVAHDYLHRLSEGKYSRGFGPLPDFIIASLLALENRLLPLIEPIIQGASTAVAVVNLIFNGTGRKQEGQSHLELLTKIAETYDAEFWVEGDILYLSRFMKEYAPRLTLTWGESLLEFTPKVTTVGQAFGVAMKFTLREIPLDFLVSVFYDFDRESIGVSVLPGAAAPAAKTGGPVFTIVDRPVGTPADIMNSVLEITHTLRTKLNNRLTGKGSAVGDTRIRSGAVLRFDGLGPDWSGDYRVISATNSIDVNGFRTSFEVRKELIP
jgi:Bacteriophage probable baseplate hub protein